MATSNNTIKTRIQLKSDTEENWRKSVLTKDNPDGLKQSGTSFVPLQGELIVFSADSTHPFSRLKVGDGNTNVVALPFIDSGTLNGSETEIVKAAQKTNFPVVGSENKLYVDLSTNIIYHFTTTNGYSQLSNFQYSATRSSIGSVIGFLPGAYTTASVNNGILTITNGVLPSLAWEYRAVVTSITRTVEE